MRKWIPLLIALFLPTALHAQNVAVNGFCDLGATPAAVSGLNSTNKLQGDIPSCTVAVYFTGTVSLAKIYSNPAGTVLSNPFTATTKGQYLFYVPPTAGYDVVMSGGIPPNTYGAPVTLTDIPQGRGAGGSGFPTAGWNYQVNATQGSGDTTLQLTGTAGLPATGLFFVGSEYETYTSVNTSTNTLSGITRAQRGTTAASHNSGTPVVSVNLPFGVGAVGGLFGPLPTLAVNNGFPLSGNPFLVNSGSNELDVLANGTIQQQTSATNYLSPLQIGVPGGRSDGTNFVIPVNNTSQLIQDSAPHEITATIGVGGGISGVLAAIPPANVGAPSMFPVFVGSGPCSITYQVTGVDQDGVEVPGTPATISGLQNGWSSPSSVTIRYPSAAGVVSYNIYRTAVSGCVGLATGKFASGVTGNAGSFSDFYSGGDSTNPPASNTSLAKSCVGTAANHELYCTTAGTSSTPNFTCSGSTQGWDYHITSAVSTPFVKVCNGTTFVTAY